METSTVRMERGIKQDVFIVGFLQLILLILFGCLSEYGQIYEDHKYAMFQDVHVMVFIGFGFLMTFLRRYSFSAVGFNYLLAALILQWAILCQGFYKLNQNHRVSITLTSLLDADVAAATVLISMGAVLGRTSYIQLLVMGFIEIAVFSANFHLGTSVFKVADAGGSIFVHTFGAYFGLAVSFMIDRRKIDSEQLNTTLESSRYTSDLFAMIGTLFLWIFWPSFNAAGLNGAEQHRAVVNTYLSLASCCVTAFLASLIVTDNNKFDMVHIQNSTLAGGVAVGTCANLLLQPAGAIGLGIVAAILSVLGYAKLSPWLVKHCHLRDTCGVHNLHGMPGVLAGLLGAFMAAIASQQMYSNEHLQDIYSAMSANPPVDSLNSVNSLLISDSRRTAGQQATYQFLALLVTMAIAIGTGLVTGYVIGCTKVHVEQSSTRINYNDALWWSLPNTEVQYSKTEQTATTYESSAL